MRIKQEQEEEKGRGNVRTGGKKEKRKGKRRKLVFAKHITPHSNGEPLPSRTPHIQCAK